MSPKQLALLRGEKTYDGKPCKRCGGTKRYTSASGCVSCYIQSSKGWNNENKERVQQIKKRWVAENPERRHAAQAKRRAARLHAAPKWVNKEAISQIYENKPKDHHVDHIVPLWGKRDGEHVVCGLHVPWNLQYLTAEENLRKSCRSWPDM